MIWNRIKYCIAFNTNAPIKIKNIINSTHRCIRIRIVNNEFNPILIGIVEGLKHEKVSENQIRLISFILKIFLHVRH